MGQMTCLQVTDERGFCAYRVYMRRLICIFPILTACPDYTLKGTDVIAAGAEDSASPADSPAPEDTDTPADTGTDTDTGQEEEPPPPVEECDGEDNDGDGEIDEGFDDSDGDGIVDCMEIMHTIDIAITVDDVWEGWADGASFAEERAGWNVLEEFSLSMDSGPHVIAIHGWDTGAAISGHLSTVRIDGVLHAVTGDGSWRVRTGEPPERWKDVDFDDSAWMTPVACYDVSPWASWTPDIMSEGAIWTWYEPTGNCRDPSAYGSAFFRLNLDLP